jgi:hypothetical protein
MEYCTQHRWEEVGNHEVDLETKDICIVTDRNGIQHSLLRGAALDRQRERTPEPRKSEPKVAIATQIAPMPIPHIPEVVEEPVNEVLPDILDAVESDVESEMETIEEWEPDPDDWYTATAIRNDIGENFLFVVLDNNEKVFIHEREIRPFGSHHCSTALPFGSEIQVRMERSKSERYAAYTALEARIQGQKPNRSEISEIVNWTGTFGSLRRLCGCAIFGKTKSPDDWFDLKPGDRVSHDLALSNRPGKGLIAVNVKPHSGEEI